MDTNKNEKVKRKLFFIVNPWLESKEFADIVIKEVYKFSDVYKKEDYVWRKNPTYFFTNPNLAIAVQSETWRLVWYSEEDGLYKITPKKLAKISLVLIDKYEQLYWPLDDKKPIKNTSG